MNITFLGTSSGVPTLTRNVSSLALKLTQTAEVWLFDCGEGTQHQLMKSDIKSSQIKKIFITHMHGDHIYGLPGLLATLGLSGNSNGIEIYGPSELKSFVTSALESSFCKLSFPLRFREVEDFASLNKILFENDKLKVHCACQDLASVTAIMSSHKIGGPKGVGAAFLQDQANITPLIKGGMQEMGYRAGTENFMLIAAFSEAIKYAKKLFIFS